MTPKTYFVKISWTDPKQPLNRLGANGKVEIDLTKDEWSIVEDCFKELGRGIHYYDSENVTVDFMMEVPSE